MATKREKTIGALVGATVGAVLGHRFAKRNGIPKAQRLKHILGGTAIGSFGGIGLAELLGTPNDTVNYELTHRGRTVYHGITYEDRILQRESEHIRSGKVFTSMIYGKTRPRVDALVLEKKLIKRDSPIYNTRHNT